MARFIHRQWRRHVNDERLILWLDGELLPDAARGVARHLDHCETCRARFKELDRTLSFVRKYREAAPDTLSRNFELRLKQEIDKRRETARPREQRTFRVSRRVGWATALAGAGLTLAVAMPSNATRALLHHFWEPVLSRFSLRDKVTTGRALPAETPAAPPTATAPVSSGPLPVRATPPIPRLRPSAQERESAEVDARCALHRIRACMGEQIEYSRDKEGYVLVQGLVDSDARKQELERALAGIHWLHARIRTVAESLRDAAPPAHAATSVLPATMPAGRTGHRRLNVPETLGRDRIFEISRRAVAESALSMQHAWSVRHILSDYPEERLARLPAEYRSKLVSVLLDHTAEWQRTLATLREDVRPMLELELAGSGSAPEDAAGSLGNLFAQAEQIDVLTRSLFAESDEPSLDPATAAPSLYSKLSGLEFALAPHRLTSLLSVWGHAGSSRDVAGWKPPDN